MFKMVKRSRLTFLKIAIVNKKVACFREIFLSLKEFYRLEREQFLTWCALGSKFGWTCQMRCWTTGRFLCGSCCTCHKFPAGSVLPRWPSSLWLFHTRLFQRRTDNCSSSADNTYALTVKPSQMIQNVEKSPNLYKYNYMFSYKHLLNKGLFKCAFQIMMLCVKFLKFCRVMLTQTSGSVNAVTEHHVNTYLENTSALRTQPMMLPRWGTLFT